jgi:hypothetical protein
MNKNRKNERNIEGKIEKVERGASEEIPNNRVYSV